MKVVSPAPQTETGTEQTAWIPGHIYIRYSEYCRGELGNPYLMLHAPSHGLVEMVTGITFFSNEGGGNNLTRSNWIDVSEDFTLWHRDML